MKRLWLVSLAGVSVSLAAALLVLSGCGGGGGPINQPGGGGIAANFLQLIHDNAPDLGNATYIGSDKCSVAGCHNDDYHGGWKNTKHFQRNVGCENCHGPGSNHAANRAAATVKLDILTFPAIQEPLVCGQCHGPIHDELMSSKHAEVVQDVVNPAPSGTPPTVTRSTTCMRCHSSALRNQFINVPWTKGLLAGTSITQLQNDADAAITPLTQPQMAGLAAWSHQTTACVTCHDPHTPTGKLLGSGEEKQLRRLPSNQDTTSVAPGSVGKVVSNWDHICGTCHNSRGGNNTDAVLQSSTARPSYHEGPQFNMLSGITGSLPPGTVIQNGSHRTAEDQCVHCHMPNARHTFTVSLDSSCLPCHTAADAAAREGSVRNEVLNRLLVLRTRLGNWAQTKFGNAAFWDYYSLVSTDPAVQAQSQAIQGQIPIEIKRVRHNYYFITRDASFGVHNAPYTRQLLDYSESLLNTLGIANRSVPVNRSAASASQQMMQILRQDRIRSILSDRQIRRGDEF